MDNYNNYNKNQNSKNINRGNNPDFSKNHLNYNKLNSYARKNERNRSPQMKIGYYQKKSFRKWGIIILIIVAIYWYFYAPIYKNPDIDSTSEWYVNDIYMSKQYYYNHLLNSEEKLLYKQIFSEINSMKEEITINISNNDSFQKIITAIKLDHPEMINFISCARGKTNGNQITYSVKYLTTSKISLKMKERKVLRTVAKVVKKTKGMTEYEKEKYIYEWLGKRINYGEEINSNYSANSAYAIFSISVNNSRNVYGGAAQILLSGVGINSIIAETTFGAQINIVKLEGEYYYMDAYLADKTEENLLGNVSYNRIKWK